MSDIDHFQSTTDEREGQPKQKVIQEKCCFRKQPDLAQCPKSNGYLNSSKYIIEE